MAKPTLHSFVPLERIGEGTFSSVYKVRRVSDNGIYALKKVLHELKKIKMASLKDKEK
jgi:serine/threonine protein kinase